MYIPDEKIEEIRTAVDIVDVVSDYVRLKKRGSNYFGLCPFHNEKTPSFSVNPSMGIYKCFGCGVGGDVFSFIRGVENVEFPEAARMLAEQAGIPLPKPDQSQERSSEIESIYHALRFAGRFFYKQLTQTEHGKPALAYLKERGFSVKTIKDFGLGYAPDRWDALLNAAEEEHVEPETLEKAGLVLPRSSGDGYYDRFRGRVIFPIQSHVGKVLGFGGRILEDDSDQPKYINSPETKVYTKSRVLYGLYQAKQAIRKREEVIMVEGYTDVISLHQAGVTNVVASSGTSLTAGQVKVLGRYAKRMLLLYDADTAGTRAALRGIDLILEEGLAPYAVALPAGNDPDAYMQEQGSEAFRSYVEKERQDFVEFTYALAQRDGTYDTPEGQAETMRSIVSSIALMPDPLMQETYLRRASDVLGIPDIQLHKVLEEFRQERRRKTRRRSRREQPDQETTPASAPEAEADAASEEAPPREPAPDPLPQEKLLLRLMLERGASVVEFVLGNMAVDEFTEGPARQMVNRLLDMYDEGVVNARRFVDGSLSEEVQQLAADVLMDRHQASENWELKQNIPVPRMNEDPYEAAASAMTILKLRRVDQALRGLKQRLYETADNDEDALRSIQREIMELQRLRKQVERREFLEWDA